MANTHPSEEMIERFARNQLPEGELAAFEEHLLVCSQCQARVAEMDRYIAAFKAAARRIESEANVNSEPAPQPLSHSAGRWPTALWAAMAAALLLAIYLFVPRSTGQVQVLALSTMRGSDETQSAKSGSPIELRLDAEGLPARDSYGVEIADNAGAAVFHAAAHRSGNTIRVSCESLRPGQYWIRISAGVATVREYSLIVK